MEPYIGEIKLFAGNFAPRGWLLCDGASLNPNNYSTLYSVIMTIYGGDGQTSFKVPDLRGRAPIQWGQGPGLSGYEIGKQAGAETVKLTVDQLPAHGHGVKAVKVGDKVAAEGNYLAAVPVDPASGEGSKNWSAGPSDVVLNAGTIANTGNGSPVTTISPLLAVTYIIAYEGIYPPRP